jgi:hypothetical protein
MVLPHFAAFDLDDNLFNELTAHAAFCGMLFRPPTTSVSRYLNPERNHALNFYDCARLRHWTDLRKPVVGDNFSRQGLTAP